VNHLKSETYLKTVNKWNNREILIGDSLIEFGPNVVKTSKYTWWNFLVKNLFIQYSKVANVYFTVLIILQLIKEISISNGQPTILPPLVIILAISM
jgi:phospholipid-transporting ATPase